MPLTMSHEDFYSRRINLKLPKTTHDVPDHERNSIALCLRLGAFCTHFGERNENEDTIEFFDEA